MESFSQRGATDLYINKCIATLSFIAFFAVFGTCSEKTELFTEIVTDKATPKGVHRLKVNVEALYSEQVSLDLFQFGQHKMVRKRILYPPSGRMFYIGHLQGMKESWAMFSVEGNSLTGKVMINGRVILISDTGNGTYKIRKSASPPTSSCKIMSVDPSNRKTQVFGEENCNLDDGSIIDVLILYTEDASSSSASIQKDINFMIDETNVSYELSGISQRLRLVKTSQVPYVGTCEPASSEVCDAGMDANRLRDGYNELNVAEKLRDIYGADIVCLLVSELNYCGIGRLFTNDLVEFNAEAFSVVKLECGLTNFSFAHEVGHNCGANHARTDETNGVALCEGYPENCVNPHPDCIEGAFCYSFGYHEPTESWRTIMAYDCPSGCPRIQYFSNPDVVNPDDGIPTGIGMQESNAADNALTMNNTSLDISQLRQSLNKNCESRYMTNLEAWNQSSGTFTTSSVVNVINLILFQWCAREYPDGMTLISAGTFTMGCAETDSDCTITEEPKHEVWISPFYISISELKFSEYDAFIESNHILVAGRSLPSDEGWGRGDKPVINVNWWDALAFCNWKSICEGLTPVYYYNGDSLIPSSNWDPALLQIDMSVNGYRLPTEAEWEKAARGIGDERIFPWGDDVPGSGGVYRANYNPNGTFPPDDADGFSFTAPVGTYSTYPSPYGCNDMAGNVGEWVQDWFDPDYYLSSPEIDPLGPSSGSLRVLRGGRWLSAASGLRVSNRDIGMPSEGQDEFGFRICRRSSLSELPIIDTFVASPAEITLGEVSTLSWGTSNAQVVTIVGEIGPFELDGTYSVNPPETTSYMLIATNDWGSISQKLTVAVYPLPIIDSFTASPSNIDPGDQSTLTWQTTSTETVTISNLSGPIPVDGSVNVSPSETTTYSLTALNTLGFPAVEDVTVNVATGPLNETKLLPSDGASGDLFGASVAIDGTTIAVGSPHDEERGSIYIFERDGGGWVESQKLTASDAMIRDRMGTVAILGDLLVAGAPSTTFMGRMGGAYVFRKIGSNWIEEQKLNASDGHSGDKFGTSVAVLNNVIIVGANEHDNGGGSSTQDSGSAYVFEWDGTSWDQTQKLTPAVMTAGDRFGKEIAVEGNILAIGANQNEIGGPNAGSVYIFNRMGGVWSEGQKLIASDTAAINYFGDSIAFEGELLAIGAYNNNSSIGAAYIFDLQAGIWTESQKLVADDAVSGDFFGFSVAANDSQIAVTSLFDDDNGDNSGSAYIYEKVLGLWLEDQKIIGMGTSAGDNLGISASMTNLYLIIGAWYDDENGDDSGAVYVFEL